MPHFIRQDRSNDSMTTTMEESKAPEEGPNVSFAPETSVSAEESAPFIEELSEEEFKQETEEKTPDAGDDAPVQEAYLQKIMFELDGHETMGKSAFQKGDYDHSYNEYKAGLRACSDLIVSSDAKNNPDLMATYQIRRRKFCVNAALTCIKIHHYQQGLEACTLLLDEGADSDMQRRKALFRAGVCARGMGELEAAKEFFKKILEEENVDELTVRDVKAQLKGLAEEGNRYKKFAKEMCNPTNEKNVDTIIIPEKPTLTEKEREKMAEAEERREDFLEGKRREKESEERMKKEGGARIVYNRPNIEMTEEDCIAALDYLAERYAEAEVQEALKEATLDHEMKFSKGFIIRSKKILAPIQKEVFIKHGFMTIDEKDEDAPIANTKTHDDALREFQKTVRYMANTNKVIADKADLCQKLAFGEVMLGDI